MNIRTAIVVCAALSAATASTAPASAGRITPGLWSFTTATQAPGIPAGVGAMTMKTCITPEEAAKDTPSLGKKNECTLTNVKSTPVSFSADAVCPGNPPTKGHFDYTFTGPTHYSGKSVMQIGGAGDGMTITTTIDAKLIAPVCSKK